MLAGRQTSDSRDAPSQKVLALRFHSRYFSFFLFGSATQAGFFRE